MLIICVLHRFNFHFVLCINILNYLQNFNYYILKYLTIKKNKSIDFRGNLSQKEHVKSYI